MPFTIELATPSDAQRCEALSQLASLSEDRAASVTGFLLGATSVARFREYSESASLYVARDCDTIIAFLIAYPRGSVHFDELLPLFSQVEWTEPSIAEGQQLMYVAKKTVHPDYRRRGVATSLYEFVFNRFPEYCFIGVTVEKPILNVPSQQFRLRHGFRRAGEFRAPEFEGLVNYQSGIYAREACLSIESRKTEKPAT
jgi:ribosomal protein S18 acetylase RimI-like enzyme